MRRGVAHDPRADVTRYYDPHFGCEIVKIKPGETFATRLPLIIATVLGSCVAACIRDTRLGTAGMNHFMLPIQKDAEPGGEAPSLRYGMHAMESLIGELVKSGSQRRDLEAKVFGGGAVVDAITADVGAQNAEFVLDYLSMEGIRTSVADLGGSIPRRVLFFVATGRVLVKYLYRLRNDTIAQREIEYARSFEGAGPPSVDLFS